VLVVGASSGVGRGVAAALVEANAGVAAMARRSERLADLGGKVVAIAGDVRSDESCAQAVQTAIGGLGGLDAVVYAAGVSDMARVKDTTFDEWRRILETNVIGAARVFVHARAELSANLGQMITISSVSEMRPKPGLVPYAASKAALRKLVEGLRSENPEIAFTIVSIGPTGPTEFGRGFDERVAEELMASWVAGGFLAPGRMSIEDVAARIVDCLTSPTRTEDLVLLPRPDPA
jgi:NAD(P)-dependent dehydrogenase (short-subunit alcohol dehydrogenase family)